PEATPHLQPIAYPQLEGLSILLVDDNQVIISVFTSLFQSHKMIVHAAKNGSEGISEAINKQPDLVLMDLHMPGTDGVTAIAEIRKKGITTPIIAISNATHRKDEALAVGANNFLLKPVNASDLLDTIAAELNL
ncbi:MAG: response regulator, partial [Cyclobacteriaceae bacterium]